MNQITEGLEEAAVEDGGGRGGGLKWGRTGESLGRGASWGWGEEGGGANTGAVLTPVQICGSLLQNVAEPLFLLPASVNLVPGDASPLPPSVPPAVRFLPFIAEWLWTGSEQAPPPPGSGPGYFRRCPAVRLVRGCCLFLKQEVRLRRNSAIYMEDLVAPPHRC